MVYLQHFSRLFCLFLFFPLVACGPKEPAQISPPKDVAMVAENFLTHVRAGSEEKAAQSVMASARDELNQSFAKDHAKLKSFPPLTPRFITQKPPGFSGPNDTEYTVIYAVKHKEKWATAEVRLFRLNDEPYEVDYWQISDAPPVAKNYTGFNQKIMGEILPGILSMFGILAVFSLLGLIVFIWLLKRRPAIINPEVPIEERVAAVAVRDGGDV